MPKWLVNWMGPGNLEIVRGDLAFKLSIEARVKPDDLSYALSRIIKNLDAKAVIGLMRRTFGRPSFIIDAFYPAEAWVLRQPSGEILYMECWPQNGHGVYLYSSKLYGKMEKLITWLDKRQHCKLRIMC